MTAKKSISKDCLVGYVGIAIIERSVLVMVCFSVRVVKKGKRKGGLTMQ